MPTCFRPPPLSVQHPIIAARVLPPHLLRVREDQQLRSIVRPDVIGDGECALGSRGNQLGVGDQDAARAGGGVVADDVAAAGLAGSALDRRVRRAVVEPSRRSEPRQRILVLRVDAIDLRFERLPAFVLLRGNGNGGEGDDRQGDRRTASECECHPAILEPIPHHEANRAEVERVGPAQVRCRRSHHDSDA